MITQKAGFFCWKSEKSNVKRFPDTGTDIHIRLCTTVDKTVEKEQESVQNENDIIFKWKGKDVTRAQFNSKEYLSW